MKKNILKTIPGMSAYMWAENIEEALASTPVPLSAYEVKANDGDKWVSVGD